MVATLVLDRKLLSCDADVTWYTCICAGPPHVVVGNPFQDLPADRLADTLVPPAGMLPPWFPWRASRLWWGTTPPWGQG